MVRQTIDLLLGSQRTIRGVRPDALARLVGLNDHDLQHRVAGRPIQVHLYAALRREQRAAVAAGLVEGTEPMAILGFARSAYNELVALLAGRDVLDTARDGEWSLRDLLRHAVAVELRYCEQVLWSAERRDDEPLGIPDARLPCDRLAPPEPEFAETRAGDVSRVLELFGLARGRTDRRLAELKEDALIRPSLWGSSQIDVRERLHQIGAHAVEVLIQTEKMLGVRDPEARRIARRIAAVRGFHEAMSDRSSVARLDEQLAWLAEQCSSLVQS